MRRQILAAPAAAAARGCIQGDIVDGIAGHGTLRASGGRLAGRAIARHHRCRYRYRHRHGPYGGYGPACR